MKFLDRLGHALVLLQNQRNMSNKQYTDKEDYSINIPSAHTFFNSFDYFLRQRMSVLILEENEKSSLLLDNFSQLAMDALVDTLIDHGFRKPKKRLFSVR